jgi:phage baseplate assembly protein gpV
VQEPVDHGQVQGHLLLVGLGEVAVGQEIEVGGNLLRADAGDVLSEWVAVVHGSGGKCRNYASPGAKNVAEYVHLAKIFRVRPPDAPG